MKKFLVYLVTVIVFVFYSAVGAEKSDDNLEIADNRAEAHTYISDLIAQQRGYMPLEEHITSLATGENAQMELELEKGIVYRFVAFCDNNCRDLDLSVYDKDSEMVAGDYRDLRDASIEFFVDETGIYVLQALMQECSIKECEVIVSSYTKKIKGI